MKKPSVGETNRAARFVAISLSIIWGTSVQADLPDIPIDSLHPLFGTWTNAQGRAHEIMTIGPKWLVTFHGDCPRRMRYRILGREVVKLEGQAIIEITMEMHDAEFVGAKAQDNCSVLELPDDYFLKISLIDQGELSNAQIEAFSWHACDTLEHLNKPPDAGRVYINACGAGGGIMNRVRKGH